MCVLVFVCACVSVQLRFVCDLCVGVFTVEPFMCGVCMQYVCGMCVCVRVLVMQYVACVCVCVSSGYVMV